MPVELTTIQGEHLLANPEAEVWQVYPRPQMKRESYINLNGYWDLAVSEQDALPEKYDHVIRVPFCPESKLSGIQTHFPDGHYLYYRRSFSLQEGFQQGRVLLHFGAVDQIADVYVNQIKVGHHEGGYESFTVDITDALQAKNELVVQVLDDLRSHVMPYGKQVLKRGGMWYTPVSGIWQTVWMESVPERYIRELKTENGENWVSVDVCDPALEGTVRVGGLTALLENGKAVITIPEPRLWSPEDPYLYEFTVEVGEDKVESYFALRTLSIENVEGLPRLCLNGKPYFFHGLLDQGYWPDGLLTPAAPECYAEDILAMKELGFNMLRKHIKVEPEEFYYQCDKLGMVVFQDMVNNGKYNFLRDTALPTVGLQILPDRNLNRDEATRQMFLKCMEATVRQLRNHPSICYWTIFNEAWGQFDSDAVCEKFRALDSSRFIDATSGWFRRKNTDVDSRHVYFREVKLKAADKPLVLSEFGGYSYKPEGHVFNTEETYGYGKFEEIEPFRAALEALYKEQIIPLVPKGLCAAVYTQVSDVEDETNGILSYDRKVNKAEKEAMLSIAQSLKI